VKKLLRLGPTERKFWNYSWWCSTCRPQPTYIIHRIQAFSVPLQCTYIAFMLFQSNHKIVEITRDARLPLAGIKKLREMCEGHHFIWQLKRH
jgi:hypothetical protein